MIPEHTWDAIFLNCKYGATVARLVNPNKRNSKLDHTTHLNFSSIHSLPLSSLLIFKSSKIKVNKPVLKGDTSSLTYDKVCFHVKDNSVNFGDWNKDSLLQDYYETNNSVLWAECKVFGVKCGSTQGNYLALQDQSPFTLWMLRVAICFNEKH